MRLIVTQDDLIVAVVDDYQGAVPRRGDYIHWPRGAEPSPGCSDGAMLVKQVGWGVIARPRNGERHFTGAAEPFAEVFV